MGKDCLFIWKRKSEQQGVKHALTTPTTVKELNQPTFYKKTPDQNNYNTARTPQYNVRKIKKGSNQGH